MSRISCSTLVFISFTVSPGFMVPSVTRKYTMTPYGTALLVRMVLMLMLMLMLMLLLVSTISYTSIHDAPLTEDARPAMFIL